MKIMHVKEKPKKKFKPFSLRIETEAEFKFLWHIFNSGRDSKKSEIEKFDEELDSDFFSVLDEEKFKQDIEVYGI